MVEWNDSPPPITNPEDKVALAMYSLYTEGTPSLRQEEIDERASEIFGEDYDGMSDGVVWELEEEGIVLTGTQEGYFLTDAGIKYCVDRLLRDYEVPLTEEFISTDEFQSNVYFDNISNHYDVMEFIHEINECYYSRNDLATMVLTRNLFENTIFNVMSKYYGGGQKDKYLDEHDNRLRFGPLFGNYRDSYDNLDDIRPGDTEDENHLDEVEEIKSKGDTSAHAFDTDDWNMGELSRKSERNFEILYRMLKNVNQQN